MSVDIKVRQFLTPKHHQENFYESNNMLEQKISINNFHKSLNLLGLSLSDSEVNELTSGNTVSLESRSLGEIGSLFILASALSASNFGKAKKTITFKDLPQVASEFPGCSGIPISSWNLESPLGKCFLYLTLADNKPALRTYFEPS